jgi:hypothetical protein
MGTNKGRGTLKLESRKTHTLSKVSMEVSFKIKCGARDKKIRLIPSLGVFTEQYSAPGRTDPKNVGKIKGARRGGILMAFQMTDSQKTVLHVGATDKKGNPTNLSPGSATWLVDNPNVATITPSADGLSCEVVAAGPLGDFKVSLSANVGGNAVSGVFDGTVISGAATQLTVTADAPVEQ